MRRSFFLFLVMTLAIGTTVLGTSAEAPDRADSEKPLSGVDLQYTDETTRAQDDFFQHFHGKWLKTVEIPSDLPLWNGIVELYEKTTTLLRGIIEELVAKPDKQPGSEEQKIGDLYESFMNEPLIEKLGIKPLAEEFARIDALTSKDEIPALLAHLIRIGVNAPFSFIIHQDAKDSTQNIADVIQQGLGLPDRDYYLKPKDARLSQTLKHYQTHIANMLSLAGRENAPAIARQIIVLETELAKAQWTVVENRDPGKTYNKISFGDLNRLTPGFAWEKFLQEAGLASKTTFLTVSQPSYLTAFGRILARKPLHVWKEYFKWHLLKGLAQYLSQALVDEKFAFSGTVLTGQGVDRPRWKRGVSFVDGALGEATGKIFVAKHFPPGSKNRIEKMVKNLLEAYRQSIDSLEWMSPKTKQEAQNKLAKIVYKIGYPEKWRDYSTLEIRKNDLIGNILRISTYQYLHELNKLGKPVDGEEWAMTPQTPNAYYNPERNEIVFPAGYLQPPYFNPKAEDAVNYGGIGAIIGHEISHAFDDKGSQYDGDGNLRNWWTQTDFQNFAVKTKRLIAQFEGFEPLPGYKVNGELTLGENIADTSGLAIAFKAYQFALGGKPSPVLDGLTGEQRFFLGWAQNWRGKIRDELMVAVLMGDPHSPDKCRTNGALQNQIGFYTAFDVKEGDKMYLPPALRVKIW